MFKIEKKDTCYTASITLNVYTSKKVIWEMLTVNSQLQKWFAELSIESLQIGGRILFDMQNGQFEEMKILELEEQSTLAFTWDKDIVKFELNGNENETSLTFTETLYTITDHTPRDLAGWHCCLDHIRELCEGVDYVQNWDNLYEKYKEILNHV